jgi:Domain of unknown function (DUF4157)
VQRAAVDDIQTKSTLQRATDGDLQADGSIEEKLSRSQTGGSPLSDDVRSFMESRFGSDFSGVRIHTGGDSVDMNRGLRAQAFTHGNHIYYGDGKAPGKNDLTAHELTHVVQQTGIVQRQQNLAGVIQRDDIEEAQSYTPPSANMSTPEGNEVYVAPPQASSTVTAAGDTKPQNQSPFWENPWFGVATDALGFVPGIGTAASVISHPFDVVNGVSAAQKGNYSDAALSAAKVGTTGAGIIAELGGFGLAGTSAVELGMVPSLAGLSAAGTAGGSTAAAGSAAAALGPVAALAGAGLAGFGLGKAISPYAADVVSSIDNKWHGVSSEPVQNPDGSFKPNDSYKKTWAYQINEWLDK